MQKLKQTIQIILFAVLILNPSFAYAQTSQQPQYGGVDQSISEYLCTPSDQADGRDLERCINKVYRFSIAFGAIALVFFIVFAGYMYITGGETGKGKAKGILQNAFIGIALLVGSYVILSFINPTLVIFKPIQPPIFTAADLPSCGDVGFGEECVLPDGTKGGTASSGGLYTPKCSKSLIYAKKDGGLPVYLKSDHQICPDMLPMIKKFDELQKQSKITWGVTAGVEGGHRDKCHTPNTEQTGNCFDMDVPIADPGKPELWEQTCKNLVAAGFNKAGIVNETSFGSDKIPSCNDKKRYDTTSGTSLHINYLVGGGGSGAVGGSSGGSRPSCKAIHGFLCDHPVDMQGKNTYPDMVWTSSDSTVQQNLTELKRAWEKMKADNPRLDTRLAQVYRPAEYSAHMRSVFEAYALLQGWADSRISNHGQYCNGSIQFVKSSDIKNLNRNSDAYRYITTHFNTHFGNFGGLAAATTCFSDHGKGIGLDFQNDSLARTKSFEAAAVAAGLCHNIPPGTSGITRGDGPHYILKSKAGGATCAWP